MENSTPTEATPQEISLLEKQAQDVLKEEFPEAGQTPLHLERVFATHPLREPYLTALFSFQPFLPEKEDRFFVFVGNVMPMIYPQMDLSVEDLWAVHIGTEFFLNNEVKEEPKRTPKVLAYLKMVATVFQEQLYITLNTTPKIEKIYLIKDQTHVVGKVEWDGKTYCWIVGDIPHFVYKKDLPPQIVWALHMGRILLN